MSNFALRSIARRSVSQRALYSTRYLDELTPNQASLNSTSRSFSSSVHENDPNILEKEKQRNLSNTQHETSTPHKNAPGWNEYIATVSEASVKADKTNGMSMEEMTVETVQHVTKRHRAEEKPTARRVNRAEEADYDKEQLAGPLWSRAVGKEDPSG